ncbi:MAG TPA: amidase [Candidatus Saccharicenans sp.]|nr:amidase [Candidatus Saccharicenans sp.]
MKSGFNSGSVSWPLMAVILSVILVIGGAFALHYTKGQAITIQDISSASKISGLNFTYQEKKMMLPDLEENLASYQKMRQIHLENSVSPALIFNPVPADFDFKRLEADQRFIYEEPVSVEVPESEEVLAFYPVTDLAWLIKNRRISSEYLTRIYLDRLKKYGPKLHCVVTLTEDLALKQARQADEELAHGIYRGPLHGIPYGLKDLLAVKGYPTTWGSPVYKDQIINEDSTVFKKLTEAGAVLVAKLSMGELAWGDVWFGGLTRNPWDPNQGSSGSSAGSASATAAGLVGFAIGTETWGSIVSPSTRCGVSGLRPTFGRVSRYGAMALSWSMDKIGPMARSVEDLALIFQAIIGPDGKDRTVFDLPFSYDGQSDLKKIRIGYYKKSFDQTRRHKDKYLAVLNTLSSMGLDLEEIELPEIDPEMISFILNVEAAAAFDELTRTNQDELMVRQGRDAWPNIFRQARFVPAVEYIQANRLRAMLIEQLASKLKEIDVYLDTPSGPSLLLTNLTGQPTVVVPCGFDDKGHPVGITFISNLFEEGQALRLAKAYQQATGFHLKHPDLSLLDQVKTSPQPEEEED